MCCTCCLLFPVRSLHLGLVSSLLIISSTFSLLITFCLISCSFPSQCSPLNTHFSTVAQSTVINHFEQLFFNFFIRLKTFFLFWHKISIVRSPSSPGFLPVHAFILGEKVLYFIHAFIIFLSALVNSIECIISFFSSFLTRCRWNGSYRSILFRHFCFHFWMIYKWIASTWWIQSEPIAGQNNQIWSQNDMLRRRVVL